ncbi:T9SS type A sorting domain-containing protein [Bacteroidota bacterium]
MKTCYMLLVFILLFSDLHTEEFDKNSLPKLLSSGNMGTEFYFSFIPAWETAGAQNDLKLYISSNVETTVRVTVPGRGFEKIKKTVPNDIIEFTLSAAVGQPYRKTEREVAQPDQVWLGAGIHVTADDPIICYGVTKFDWTCDGFLAIPVPALGKEYIVASYADPINTGTTRHRNSFCSVTAAYDKTQVSFTMGGNDWSETASGTLPGETTNWNLNAGDVFLVASVGHQAELTGSKIVATKPVGVVSGNFCAYVPSSTGRGDVLEEMEFPTSTWGAEYHVSPMAERKTNSMIKIFAKEDNTMIYRDHNNIGFIRTSGGIDGIGYIHIRADDGDPRPIVISGDKSISVTQFNTGRNDDDVASDPFQMALIPLEQYQREMTFHPPGVKDGSGFSQNYINICYEATEWGTIPDDMMFGQVDGDEFSWVSLSDFSPNPGQPFEKKEGGKTYYSKSMVLPAHGVYKLKSSKPFTVYSYGITGIHSYGMPASASLKNLEVNDTLPPEPEWLMDNWGNVNDQTNPDINTKYVTDRPDDPLSRSNLSTIYMHSDKSYNYRLYYDEFMPCEDYVTTWGLDIIDGTEDAYAVVTFSDCAGNDTTLFMDYNAAKIKFSENHLDFGRHSVGERSGKTMHFINYSETSAFDLKDIKLKKKDDEDNPQGFALWQEDGLTPLTFPIMVEPLDTFKFLVRFVATEEGEFWDSVGHAGYCGQTFWYKTLVEANVGMPIIDVTDWNFPPTNVDASAWGEFDIKNRGTVNLEIYEYQGPFITGLVSGTKIYSSQELEDRGITAENPLILHPDETATFQIRFTPDDSLSYPDSIIFISNTRKMEHNELVPDSVCRMSGTGLISTNVDTENNKDLIIYPNPGSDKLIISGLNNNTRIRIYDMLGNVKLDNEMGYDKIIDISRLESGIYMINVISGDEVFVRKLIIRR